MSLIDVRSGISPSYARLFRLPGDSPGLGAISGRRTDCGRGGVWPGSTAGTNGRIGATTLVGFGFGTKRVPVWAVGFLRPVGGYTKSDNERADGTAFAAFPVEAT